MAVTLSLTITQNSQNVGGNTSNVTVKAIASWTYGSWNGTNKCTGSITIDGVQYSFSGMSFNTGQSTTGSQVVMEKTVNVGHNADGSKTVQASASFVTGVGSGTITASGSKALTTIPRTSEPTVSPTSVDMGGAVTITTNRASSNFTHDLAYSFAGGSYVTIATGVGASYSWTTPDLANSIPDSVSGTVTIRCITKNGNTTIGTKTVTMTLKVPSSVVPTISTVATEEATAGIAARFGAFIKTKSTIKATITASGAKGSTIKSYSTTFNGRTYTGASWTSAAVTASGTLSLVTTVTDSRGRTAKKTTNISVLDYANPAINSLQAFRLNADGAADQDGIYLGVKYKYSVTSLGGKNTASMKIEYKRSIDASGWAQLLTGTDLSADTTAKPQSPTFSTDYQYDVRLTLTDFFNATSTYTVQLPSGAVVFDIAADGKSMAVGKTTERQETFEVGWELLTYHAEIPKDALAIPGGADLDAYNKPGFYVFAASAYSTIANMPIGGSGSGSVQVIREGEANQVRQVVTRCSAASREIWERLFYSNAWQEWQCVHKAGTSRVLWTGGMYMTAGHVIALDEPISKQPNGIVLVFSEYVDGEVKNQTFARFFVDKATVALHAGGGCNFQMCTSNLAFFATKYLYIHDTQITGHANNNQSGTGACGITYTNNRFVLRYVIGV